MKNIFLIIVIIFVAQKSFSQIETVNDSAKITVIEEIMPSWIGCENEINEEERSQCTNNKIQEFLSENLKYPDKAKRKNVTGTVYLTFVLNKTGKIEDIRVLRSVSPELDNEAIRLISSMPNFNPGFQRGKPVAVQYNLPIKFSLSNTSKSK